MYYELEKLRLSGTGKNFNYQDIVGRRHSGKTHRNFSWNWTPNKSRMRLVAEWQILHTADQITQHEPQIILGNDSNYIQEQAQEVTTSIETSATETRDKEIVTKYSASVSMETEMKAASWATVKAQVKASASKETKESTNSHRSYTGSLKETRTLSVPAYHGLMKRKIDIVRHAQASFQYKVYVDNIKIVFAYLKGGSNRHRHEYTYTTNDNCAMPNPSIVFHAIDGFAEEIRYDVFPLENVDVPASEHDVAPAVAV